MQAGERGVVLLYGEIRDALAHLSNKAYLSGHPLLARLQQTTSGTRIVTAHDLEELLAELIETVKPPTELPACDPAWRAYVVLRKRYYEGLEAKALCRAMGLSIRQVQREQRCGLLAMARALASRLGEAWIERELDEDSLGSEIRRVAEERQLFDARGQVRSGLESVAPLAASRGVSLQSELASLPMLVAGHPLVFRQLFIAAVSHVLRQACATSLRVSLAQYGQEIILSLVAACGNHSPLEKAALLSSELVTLAQNQDARLDAGMMGANWYLHIRLPAAERERTVALIDDNRDLAMLFARYLKGHGYGLHVISEGATALDQLAGIEPHVIVLDIMMRGVDGWELLRDIKAEQGLQGVPVVVCSVLNQPELAEALGADAYLVKPVNRERFLECLAQVLPPTHTAPAGSQPARPYTASAPRS